ncbi:MAG: glycosyltransferase [Bacteroidales bacterium]|nr:glycosyltransferase [Bacteroidales bacterium]
MARYSHIAVVVPLLDELENIVSLVSMLRRQTSTSFTLYVCVNQPEPWWQLPESDWRRQACEHNRDTLALLSDVDDIALVVTDRSTQGHGWKGKHQGVGWARKTLMDCVAEHCGDDELVVSLDADTRVGDDYLQAVLTLFNAERDASAMAAPYYHRLSGNMSVDRMLLRYECYMRNYLVRLLRIGSPYAFTALGSAMAFPVWAYRRVGGITPLPAGEDFYLLQKFVKTGSVLLDGVPTVFPEGRLSRRVPFGTGPALSLTMDEMERRYPMLGPEAFDAVKRTFDAFPELYDRDIDTPMSEFLRRQLKTDELWGPLRKNYKQRDLFVRACRERVDGLRIQQFVKTYAEGGAFVDVDFRSDSLQVLDDYRNQLFSEEMMLRKQHHRVGCAVPMP